MRNLNLIFLFPAAIFITSSLIIFKLIATNISFWGVIVFSLVLTSALYFLCHCIVLKPLRQLKTAAQEITEEDTEEIYGLQRTDDVGQLANLIDKNMKYFKSLLVDVEQKKKEAEKVKTTAEKTTKRINEQYESVTSRIQNILTEVEKLSTGDLTVKFTADKDDLIGKLDDGLNRAIADIRKMILQIKQSIESSATATTQISSSTEQLASGAHEQSSQTSEVAASVEEMSKTIIENSKNANSTSESATQAKEAAEMGGKVVHETVTGMKNIASVVNKSAKTVQNLGQSSDQIGEIINVIDDIADQTNLLALNAAIEAARAGDQGRGFAVVADEVRKLAERTTKATQKIVGMINKIQSETANAVKSMNEGTKEVENGIKLADEAGASLKEIVQKAVEVKDRVSHIAAASAEQSTASEEISQNVESISTVTQQSASGMQQIARTVEDLNRLTDQIQQLTKRFKVDHENTEESQSHEYESEETPAFSNIDKEFSTN